MGRLSTEARLGIALGCGIPLAIALGVLAFAWFTIGRIIYPDAFPVDYSKIDTFVEDFHPETIAPVVDSGHSADSLGNSNLRYTVIYEDLDAADIAIGRLKDRGFVAEGDGVPDPQATWVYRSGSCEFMSVTVRVMDAGDGAQVTRERAYWATGPAVALLFWTSAYEQTECT